MSTRAATPMECGWLAERSGYLPAAGFRAILSETAGIIRGMVGFDGWTPNAVALHVAIEKPGACRTLLRAAFGYAFVETGRRLAVATIREGNTRSIRLARHVGFREVHRTRSGWAPGEDLVHFEMRREDCRWLEENHG